LLITRLASIPLLMIAIMSSAQSPLEVGWLVATVQAAEYVVLSYLVFRGLRGLLKTPSTLIR
jgi:hypothetical protein